MNLPRTAGNTNIQNFDVIVIGSGAGGSSVAAILAQAGKKVLILEAGPNYFVGLDNPDPKNLGTVFSNDELKLVHRRLVMPDPLIEPRTFRVHSTDTAGQQDDVNYLPKIVGGGAVHADFKTPRFAKFDFQLGNLPHRVGLEDTNFANWPITYDDLEPFYNYIETLIGVQGPAQLNGPTPPGILRTNGYPLNPGPGMYGSLLVADAAAQLGYTSFAFPAGIISQDYNGRPACMNCGFCGNYGCGINAKSSPAVTTLRQALLTGNCLLLSEMRAVRLQVDGAGKNVTGVTVIPPDGADLKQYPTYTAQAYVLAASPIESARLLFLSAAGGLGNSSDQVGRNLMFHYQTVVAGIFDQRLHPYRGRSVTHGIADFRGDPTDMDHRPLGGLVEFGVSIEPILEATQYLQRMRLRGPDLWTLIKASPLRDRLLTLTMHGEDAPQTKNRIELDDEVRDIDNIPVPRITYSNHSFELATGKFYETKLMDILKQAGATYGLPVPAPSVPNTRHVMGTLRFGTDPATSVCGPNGQFHDINNLYAADGSLFPTSSGCNPTLTIMALATRIGAQMLSPDDPTKVIRPVQPAVVA